MENMKKSLEEKSKIDSMISNKGTNCKTLHTRISKRVLSIAQSAADRHVLHNTSSFFLQFFKFSYNKLG